MLIEIPCLRHCPQGDCMIERCAGHQSASLKGAVNDTWNCNITMVDYTRSVTKSIAMWDQGNGWQLMGCFGLSTDMTCLDKVFDVHSQCRPPKAFCTNVVVLVTPGCPELGEECTNLMVLWQRLVGTYCMAGGQSGDELRSVGHIEPSSMMFQCTGQWRLRVAGWAPEWEPFALGHGSERESICFAILWSVCNCKIEMCEAEGPSGLVRVQVLGLLYVL